MTNEVTRQEYELRALESQYMDDLRLKNRVIAQLRTENQLLKQQVAELANHTHDDDAGVELVDVEPEDSD